VREVEARVEALGIEIVAALIESENVGSLAFFGAIDYLHSPEVEYVSKRRSADTWNMSTGPQRTQWFQLGVICGQLCHLVGVRRHTSYLPVFLQEQAHAPRGSSESLRPPAT
jgi:hypothetical protein